MALEEIAVADIRKGQVILQVDEIADIYRASSFTAEADYVAGGSISPCFRYYLLADVPQPPRFEVPKSGIHRDKHGEVWDFDRQNGNHYAAESIDDLLAVVDLQGRAPFARMYTVQELIDIVGEDDFASGLGGGVAYHLAGFLKRGII